MGEKVHFMTEKKPRPISTAWVVLIYGVLLIILGYVGYQAGSKISFYTGGSFGLMLIASSIFIFCKIRLGSLLALYLSLILTVTFAFRYLATQKNLPGILSLLSAVIFVFLILRMGRWKK